MTSGNISDEPLICKNELALQKLGDVADAFLMHDREIYRQVDDSIVHFVGDPPRRVLLRRSRGYVPTPIIMEENSSQEILAAGADLKNTFCLLKQNQLICSEHIGDLEDAEVYHHYIASIEHLRKLFEVHPQVVVCDLHPGYMSTQYAQSLPGVRIIEVQHHWAHVASVLAEHNLNGPVIGIVCDGTGYGTDGAIWGCECLIASLTNFERFSHFAYFPLAGADKASKEAVRPALSLLMQAYGAEFDLRKFSWLLERIEPDTKENTTYEIRHTKYIVEQIEKRINTVETSSLGRVFDAVAAMLGLGGYNHFDAQLPMALEAIAAEDVEDRYELEAYWPPGEPYQFGLCKIIRQLVSDVQNDVDAGIISAKFHNTIAEILLGFAVVCRSETNFHTVALSGGVFCNRYLTNRLIKQLKQNDFHVLFNRDFPSNDGGISLGQAAIAAAIVIRDSSPVSR
jgi:hydrogenase maturation protein HypF